MVSVMVSQRLDRELSWCEYRVEFLPIRTDMSGRNPTLVCGRGTHRPSAFTFRIRRRTRRLDGDSVFPGRVDRLAGRLADFDVGSLGNLALEFGRIALYANNAEC
jgi:hypothetical protein